MTMSVVGFYLLGARRVATGDRVPGERAHRRHGGLRRHAACAGADVAGRLGRLVWYAALPWLLHLVRRGAGLETADPSTTGIDLVDGVAPVGLLGEHAPPRGARPGVDGGVRTRCDRLFVASALVVALATLLVGDRGGSRDG